MGSPTPTTTTTTTAPTTADESPAPVPVPVLPLISPLQEQLDRLQSGLDTLDDITVLRITGGSDFFCVVHAEIEIDSVIY